MLIINSNLYLHQIDQVCLIRSYKSHWDTLCIRYRFISTIMSLRNMRQNRYLSVHVTENDD